MNNQYILGSTGFADIERRQLLLPWLLHPDAEKVCCLGLATGISASGLEVLDNPPSVTSVELSHNVTKIAEEFFEQENGTFFQRSNNRVIVEDARTYVAALCQEYDLIVADLFRPHGVGEGRLFAVEHFQNVKRALRPGGMFCQWLPGHQLNEGNFRTIAATFLSVFPESLVIVGGSTSRTPSIGLCAWENGKQWNVEELKRKIERIRKEPNVTDKLVLNAQLLICGTLKNERFKDNALNTLDNTALEINAGRFWILKDLRRNRAPDDLKSGFLSGQNMKLFLAKLFEDTTPVLDPIHQQQFLRLLK